MKGIESYEANLPSYALLSVKGISPDGPYCPKSRPSGYNRRESLGTGSAFGVAPSADPQQRFVYVTDGSNERIAILDRNTLELIGSIGPGTQSR